MGVFSFNLVLLLFLVIQTSTAKTTALSKNETTDDTLRRLGFFNIFDNFARRSCNVFSSSGSCVLLLECPALINQVRHVHPGRVFQHLQDYVAPCGSRWIVCCPENELGANVDTIPPGLPAPSRVEDDSWKWPEPVRPQRPENPRPGGDNFEPELPFDSFREDPPQNRPPFAEKPVYEFDSDEPGIPTNNGQRPSGNGSQNPGRTTRRPERPSKPNKVSKPSNLKHKNRNLLPEKCGLDLSQRILGGQEAGVGEHPWMALIRLRLPTGGSAFFCGGTIINERYVLTAAHCLKGSGATQLGVVDLVRLGEHDLSKSEDCTSDGRCNRATVDIRVEQRIVHPDYTPNDPGTYNDIALLRLKDEIQFNGNIQPICLPLEEKLSKNLVGRNLVAVGWGKVSNGDQRNSEVKRKVAVPVVTNNDCAPQYRKREIFLRDTQFCAGGEEGKDSCQGDSGGPLLSLDVVDNIERWYIQGITSTGPKDCGLAEFPAIYTRVSKFIPWILDNIKR